MRKISDHTQGLIGIVVLAIASLALVGFVVAGTLVPSPPPVTAKVSEFSPVPEVASVPQRMAVIGDSYAVGVGAGDMSLGWAPRLAWNQQWQLGNFAKGGTGYVSDVADPVKAKIACGLDMCPRHEGVIPDVVAFQPTLVIVTGGRNDGWVTRDKAAIEIKSFYEELRARLPSSTIVAFNPIWDSNDVPSDVVEVSELIRSAVVGVGGVYLDAGQPLKGKPDLLAADRKHPNSDGHRVVFESYLFQLQQAGIASK